MSLSGSRGPDLRRRPRRGGGARRQLVRSGPYAEGQTLPWMIEPAVDGLDPLGWAEAHRDEVTALVDRHGAVLLRRFALATAEDFNRFIAVLCGDPLAYTERSSPRHAVHGNVYTSTDHPADQSIFPHNEHSYRWTFPQRIAFFCEQPAERGGETPLGDCRRLFERLPASIRDRFLEEGYLYARNFNEACGLPWQTAFQTDDRSAVEAYCREMKIDWEWTEGGGLRTRQVRPVAARHPRTGDVAWFNHLTFFHVTTLEPEVQDLLCRQFDDENLPNNTYHTDGSPIEPEVLETLRGAYLEAKVAFPWQRGDVLVVDNMLTSHGREPFEGRRRVLAAMTEPVDWDTVRVEG